MLDVEHEEKRGEETRNGEETKKEEKRLLPLQPVDVNSIEEEEEEKTLECGFSFLLSFRTSAITALLARVAGYSLPVAADGRMGAAHGPTRGDFGGKRGDGGALREEEEEEEESIEDEAATEGS